MMASPSLARLAERRSMSSCTNSSLSESSALRYWSKTLAESDSSSGIGL